MRGNVLAWSSLIVMVTTYPVQSLRAEALSSDNFAPFGQVIWPNPDGVPFGPQDAQLRLEQGIPRFYIMHLEAKGRGFYSITRHQRCTQCLGALGGQDWLIAVAAPSAGFPRPEDIRAFRVPGHCFINLKMGTWHAGPYFEQDAIDFYNLELSDTNQTDHETCNLRATHQLQFEIV